MVFTGLFTLYLPPDVAGDADFAEGHISCHVVYFRMHLPRNPNILPS